jgi:branched-chain amino acid transport system permease protein
MTIKNKEGNFLKKNFFLIILGMLLVFLPIPVGTYMQSIILMVVMYAYFASCWNILCGFLGVLSLGHAVFLGIGAYISSCLFLYADVSPWFGMLVGGLIVAVLSIVIGFATFRMRGPYFTLTTIAMGEMIRVWVETNDYFLGIDIKGSRGLLLPSKGESFLNLEFSNKLGYYYVILAMLVLVLIISHLILKSRLGYYMTAIKSDETAAESLGIVPLRYKLIGIALSSFLISLGGTFYAHYYHYINPTRIFGSDLSVQIALIALIGGQGKVLGPVFGAVLLIPISELLAMLFGGQLPGLHLFVYGIALMLCVRYLPDGIHDLIIGFFQKVQAKLFRERN